MTCTPRGDNPQTDALDSDRAEWERVLEHRRLDAPATLDATIDRFRAAGVTPEDVASHLRDAGDRLYRAAASGEDDWAATFGGERAVALLAAEVSALMSHLVARAANVRSVCVDALLDEFSAVTVASALGVARQKVYELARHPIDSSFLSTTHWRSS